jgi:hypothetical protein
MKLFSRFLAAGLLTAGLGLTCASGADSDDIKTVYLLPMANGLDQYLAIRLTTNLIFQVVTDPLKADAILTDRIGTSFEQKLNELYSEPKKKEESDPGFGNNDSKATMSPLSRGKGAIFLVDRKTRNVLWSTYATTKNTSADAMNHLAGNIADKLAKERKGK